MAGKTLAPLEPKRFFVLLALSKEPMHAYAVHEQAVIDSASSLYLSFASLRRILAAFEQSGHVLQAQPHRVGPHDIPRYALTPRGQQLLKMTAARLESAAMLVRRRVL